MYTLILLVATSLGYGSVEIHTSTYETEAACTKAAEEMTVYIDQPDNMKVTYHCVETDNG